MAEKKEVLKQVVKHIGFFHFRDLYNFCYEWIKDEGYMIAEDQYTEKLSADGKELIIVWTAKKKVSDYFMNIIILKWHILRMTDAEVEINGKKQKTNKGEVKITFTGELVRDYEKRWEDNPFYKFLRGFYDRYIIRTTMDKYEDQLEDKTKEYINQVKSFLVLEGKSK